VILLARNEERLKKALQQLDKSQGQQHQFLLADFSNSEEVKRVINDFIDKENSIHILINNTGGPKAGNILDAVENEFIKAFESHLLCNHILAKAVIPGMKESGYGRIVNIISTSVKQPIPGLGVSNTIRGAVASWAKSLASELGEYGITVNNVLPGYTRTARYDSLVEGKSSKENKSMDEVDKQYAESIPLKRIGTKEEFGAAVAFLCTPAAGYISGINLPVDGGRLSCL
ncbi:MAG: SDR family oxidoreductase, partial [Ginsengibacter sp.]